jgi:L-2-hydroxyglutarate oxidase LhgO
VGLLHEYCAERDLPYDECGKLVVALDHGELAALREIDGAVGPTVCRTLCGWMHPVCVSSSRTRPGWRRCTRRETAITDYGAICRALAEDVVTAGGQLRLGARVTRVEQLAAGVRVTILAAGRPGGAVTLDALVLCAGLQSDSLARSAGDQDGPAIVPFRGSTCG